MATMDPIKGLETVQTNNPNTTRKDGREPRRRQTNRQVSLRPQASPAQRYNRPAQPQRNQQAEQVANALQSVSPTMGKLSSFIADKKRKEAEQQAQAEIQQLSMEEAEKMVNSGEISEYENPYFQEAFQRQYGVRLGLSKSRELKSKFATDFNARTDDVDQFIAENMGVDMGSISQNPLIEGGFSDAMNETLTTIRDEAAKKQAAAYEKDKLDGIYETFNAEFERPLSKASTPEERKAAIENGYKAIRSHYSQNRERLNVSNGEQDAVLMQVAAKYAREGQVDVVEKILTDNRGGVGSIIDTRGKKGAEAAATLREAEKNAEEDNRERTFDQQMAYFDQAEKGQLNEDEFLQWHKDNPGVYSTAKVQSIISKNRAQQEAKHEALAEQRAADRLAAQQNKERSDMLSAGLEALRSGQAHNMPSMVVTNNQGEQEVMPGEDIVEETKTYLQEQWIPEQVKDAENPGEAAFNLQMDIYSKNPGLVNEEWKATLENASGALSAAAAADGGSIPPKLREGFQLYQRMSARNPSLRDSLISEEDKQVYESLRIAENYMGMTSFEDAVTRTFKVMNNDDIDENPSIQARYDEVDTAVANLNGTLDGWGDVKNDSYVTTELRKIGRHIARAGGPTGLKEATRRFKEEHEFVNGWAVPTKGKNVPDNFKQIAERKINEYVEKNPDEGVSEEDISLFPLGGQDSSGVWTLVDNTTGSPLQDRIGSQFTLSELKREAEQREEQAARDAIEDANESNSQSPRLTPEQRATRGPWRGSDTQASGGPIPDVSTGVIGGAIGELLGDRLDTTANAAKGAWQDVQNRLFTSPGELSPEEMAAEPEDGTRSEDLGTVQPSSGNAKLPEKIDPKVRNAVQKFREANITKTDFDNFLERARGEKVRWAGTANDGSNLDTTFAVNPTIREKIRQYLPAS